jgi:hypothetical protein
MENTDTNTSSEPLFEDTKKMDENDVSKQDWPVGPIDQLDQCTPEQPINEKQAEEKQDDKKDGTSEWSVSWP